MYIHVLHDIATVLVAIGAGLGLANCLVYGIAMPWERSTIGRIVITLLVSLTLIQMLSLSTRLFGEWPGRAIAVLVLYLLFVISLGWMLIYVLRERRAARREE